MTYIPALVELILLALENPAASTDEVFVVADEPIYTMNEIYDTIADALGVGDPRPIRLREPLPTLMKYVQRTLERFDVHVRETHVAWEMSRHIAADPGKATSVLGWEPATALAPGMAEAVEWARDHGQV
jgi:nucleoside-diphosphate-sugar epimerase